MRRSSILMILLTAALAATPAQAEGCPSHPYLAPFELLEPSEPGGPDPDPCPKLPTGPGGGGGGGGGGPDLDPVEQAANDTKNQTDHAVGGANQAIPKSAPSEGDSVSNAAQENATAAGEKVDEDAASVQDRTKIPEKVPPDDEPAPDPPAEPGPVDETRRTVNETTSRVPDRKTPISEIARQIIESWREPLRVETSPCVESGDPRPSLPVDPASVERPEFPLGASPNLRSHSSEPDPAGGADCGPADQPVDRAEPITPASLWVEPPARLGPGLWWLAAAIGATAVLLRFLLLQFTRIPTPRLLEHNRRRLVHDLVQATPGLHLEALQRETGLSRGTVDHHIRKLVQASLLVEHRSIRARCFFPPGQIDRRLHPAAAVLRAKGARRVFEAVQAGGFSGLRALSRRLGLSAPTVRYHLGRFQEAGLVRLEARSSTLEASLTDLGRWAATAFASRTERANFAAAQPS